MSDAKLGVQQAGTPDRQLDNELVLDGSGNPVYRQRVQQAGALIAEIVAVKNSAPGGTEYGSVVRNIPSGTQAVSAASLPLPTGAAQEHVTAASPHAVRASDGSGFISVAIDRTTAAAPFAARLTDGSAFYAAPAAGQLPAALVGGRLSVDVGASVAIVLGAGVAAIGTVSVSNMIAAVETGLAKDATLTGGTVKAIHRGGAKGVTTAADVTSTAEGADHQAIDVQLYHGGAAKDPTAVRALTSADVVTAAQGTAAAATAPWASRLSDGAAFYDAVKTGQLPAALVSGRVDVNVGAVPTLTKGTQGATGFSVQPLRDAGRVLFAATASAVTGSTSEVLITLTPYRDLVAGGGATTHAVTAGKRLRLQTLVVTWRNNTAAIGAVTVRFRMLAGTVLVGSPVHASLGVVTSAATIGLAQTATFNFPDGFELSGTMQFGLTQLALGAVVGFDVHVLGFEY